MLLLRKQPPLGHKPEPEAACTKPTQPGTTVQRMAHSSMLMPPVLQPEEGRYVMSVPVLL
jgi:hypothetical protein